MLDESMPSNLFSTHAHRSSKGNDPQENSSPRLTQAKRCKSGMIQQFTSFFTEVMNFKRLSVDPCFTFYYLFGYTFCVERSRSKQLYKYNFKKKNCIPSLAF